MTDGDRQPGRESTREGSRTLALGVHLQERLAGLVLGRSLPGLSLFGVGQAEVMGRLTRLEQVCRSRVWNMQPAATFDPEDPSLELDVRSRARGIELRLITTERASRFHPLLSSLNPYARIGVAPCKFLVIDEACAVVAGPDTADGETTAWIATSGPVLDAVLACWKAAWVETRPLLAPGEEPPLNRRQVAVARYMCLGRTDEAIARLLGVSVRTVARDVAAIMTLTGTHSRSAAVLTMLGRGRHTQT